MKINRVWAMSNSHTFSIPPISELIDRYVGWGDVIVDPFANDSTIGTITNDLNPKFDTDYHMDALDFLKSIDTAYADVVLYDPPYSPRQVKGSVALKLSRCWLSLTAAVKMIPSAPWSGSSCYNRPFIPLLSLRSFVV